MKPTSLMCVLLFHYFCKPYKNYKYVGTEEALQHIFYFEALCIHGHPPLACCSNTIIPILWEATDTNHLKFLQHQLFPHTEEASRL